MGIKSHIWRVHGDGKNFVPGTKGKPAWSRGLTKETSGSVRKWGETHSRRCKSGEIVPWPTGHTKDSHPGLAKQSRTMTSIVNAKLDAGTWHNSFARARKQTYAGQSFDGMWEVHLAKWFDQNDIKWERNKLTFPYTYDKPRKYIPDFYLPNIDCFVEVKGWKTAKDEAKWKAFPRNLIVLSGHELKTLGLPVQVKKQKS